MKVIKFGGSSCADSKQCKKILDIVREDPQRQIVVVSAPGKRNSQDHKVTDMLYLTNQLTSIGMGGGEVFGNIAMRYIEIRDGLGIDYDIEKDLHEIYNNILSGAGADYCASRGEYLAAKLMAVALGYEFADPKDFILFDGDGRLDREGTLELTRKHIKRGNYLVPGFYGANKDGDIVTFSRGGSDITGSILAAACNAEIYENWTDVSGFLAADPTIVDNPEVIKTITYEELHELSYMGAGVLHEDAVYPARQAGIPIHIKNTNRPEDPGTVIVPYMDKYDRLITGLAGKKGFMVVNVTKNHGAGDSGFLRRLSSVFEANHCAIEHIPSSIDTYSVIVRETPFRSKQKKILEEIDIFSEPDSIKITENIALLAVVGRGMAQKPGVAAGIFNSLARAGISIRMISQGASELNIIVGVNESDFDSAVRVLYDEFFKK